MKFKHKYEYIAHHKSIESSELIDSYVYYNTYNVQGRIEELSKKVKCLTEILGVMMSSLPESTLIAVAEKLGFERSSDDEEVQHIEL